MASVRTFCRALAAFMSVTSVFIATADAQNCEPRWDLEFASQGANGWVLDSLVFDDGTGPALYMTGWFDEIGGERAWALARWDGRRWHEVGGGLSREGAPGDGMGLAVWDDGNGPALYVAGAFDHAGDVPANNIARWNGREWSALGDGTDDAAWELCAFDDGSGSNLYIGGSFLNAGGIEVNHISRWDGREWRALGAGLGPFSGRNVGAMAVFDDGGGPDLYVGGEFYSPATYLARWDGSEWSALDGVHLTRSGSGYGPIVEELIVFDDGTGPALYLTGSVQQYPIGYCFLKWDGHQVTQPAGLILGPGPYPETMTVEETSAGPVLWVGGGPFRIADSGTTTTLARWDGQAWSSPASYASLWIYTLSAFDDGYGPGMFVAGDLRRIVSGNKPLQNVVRWSAPHMALQHTALRAGQPARFGTTCATPGGRVYFTYSTTGLGSFFVPQLNVTLDLEAPHLAGSGIADPDGKAELIRRIPPDASGRTVYLQAAEQGRKSEVVEAMIE